MKTTLKFAVLLTTLFLLSGSAFAFCWPPQDVACYRVTATDLDNHEDSCTRDIVILANFENQCGILFAPPVNDYPISLMFLSMYVDAMKQKMSGGLLGFDSISLKFHGDMGHVLNGELASYFLVFCDDSNQEHHRYELRGTKLENCSLITSSASLGSKASDYTINIEEIENLVKQTETLLNQTGVALQK